MKFNHSTQRWILVASFASALFASASLHAQTEIAKPRVAEISADHGPLQPLQQINFTVHLNAHNQAAFDSAVEALYTPGSSTYHQWLTEKDLAQYAPTAADVEAVKKELEGHGLAIVSVSPDNFSIRVRGTTGSVESAFQTQIHEFERQGKTFHANVTPARLAGTAGALVHGVTGLTNFQMRPYVKFQVDPKTGKKRTSLAPARATATGGWSGVATNACFQSATSISLTTQGASLPVGQYYGNIYSQPTNLICSWTPAQIETHYGIDAAIKQGLDGTGQTIVIVDGPADGTQLTADLKQFATLSGLPAITSSNFKVLYPDGQPTPLSLQVDNWQDEASLDVEWAHAIAPKANIVIEIMPTEDWDEFEFAIDYARQNKLGKVISNSYGYPEALFGAATVNGFEQVLKKAAAAGLAVNFSTGDGGDEGTGAPNAGGQSYPATSAYVTAIGGTSIGIPNGNAAGAEVGWGNNATYLSFGATSVVDPPDSLGNIGGAGGGESTFISKPSWQKSFSGTGRLEPDISAVADPYTGVVFVENGQALAGIGGTSLSSPIFSAIWALADQKAGASLGQAAPLLAKLPAKSITDIVPFSSATNVAGIVFDTTGSHYYSSDALLAPLYTTTQYYSAAWDLGSGEYVDLSFGTDTTLTVATGWDNVTGWGIPNGVTFINAAAKGK
jgi:subtilase family serine protease